MTIRQALKKYQKIEIDLLLAHVLGGSKEFVFLNLETSLSAHQLIRLSALARRRQNGEPMAYLLGYKDFYGLRFKVNKHVLIPRPETEWVVNQVKSLKLKVERRQPLKILDIGTGSGCISISLAREFKNKNLKFKITASDISTAALKVAKQNAKAILLPSSDRHIHTSTYECDITFIKSDLLNNIKFVPNIIIANLPYGWHGVKNRFSSVKDGLKFEPKEALFTKEKGLFQIRRLLQQIKSLPTSPELIYLEFDPRQKTELKKLIKKYLPKASIIFYRDQRHLWRYAEIFVE